MIMLRVILSSIIVSGIPLNTMTSSKILSVILLILPRLLDEQGSFSKTISFKLRRTPSQVAGRDQGWSREGVVCQNRQLLLLLLVLLVVGRLEKEIFPDQKLLLLFSFGLIFVHTLNAILFAYFLYHFQISSPFLILNLFKIISLLDFPHNILIHFILWMTFFLI